MRKPANNGTSCRFVLLKLAHPLHVICGGCRLGPDRRAQPDCARRKLDQRTQLLFAVFARGQACLGRASYCRSLGGLARSGAAGPSRLHRSGKLSVVLLLGSLRRLVFCQQARLELLNAKIDMQVSTRLANNLAPFTYKF